MIIYSTKQWHNKHNLKIYNRKKSNDLYQINHATFYPALVMFKQNYLQFL